jgi:hypothetical protein
LLFLLTIVLIHFPYLFFFHFHLSFSFQSLLAYFFIFLQPFSLCILFSLKCISSYQIIAYIFFLNAIFFFLLPLPSLSKLFLITPIFFILQLISVFLIIFQSFIATLFIFIIHSIYSISLKVQFPCPFRELLSSTK